ncbi:MAG TPA: type II secretion system protein [Tepidisphaeraceae bacterium]|nr:type II secretion system protein [Tepidisphaeraceae bacterium]
MATRPNNPSRCGATGALRCAFTLVELLIVVTIIGILATVVIPQFSNASTQARENALKDELRYLRTQIVVYKAQHKDTAPGANGGNFVQQMTMFTDDLGATSATRTATHKFGPYVPKIAKNPINDLSTIEISNQDPLVADGGHGWKYNPNTQEIIADVMGNDTVGTPFARY